MNKNKLRKNLKKRLYSHLFYKKLSLGILEYIEKVRLLNNFKKCFFNEGLFNKSIFALYYPLRYEISCFLIIKWLKKLNCTVVLPKINKNSKKLNFYIFNKDSLLINNNIGINEIVLSSNVESVIPEVVIAPLIAFDMQGNRLGQGGGYYDYTLNELRSYNKIKVIGMAYSWQHIKNLYTDCWDAKLDCVVTEKYYKTFN